MNAAPADVDKLSRAIAGCDGASEKMAKTMQDNLAGQLTILKSQLQELAISIGDALMPTIRSIVSFLQGVVDKLNSMDEGTRNFIIRLGLLIAAAGPLLIFIGKIISAVGSIMTFIPALAGGIGSIIGVLGRVASFISGTLLPGMASVASAIASVVGWPVLIFGAVAAGIALLYTHCEGFRAFINALWENIKEVAVTVWNALKDFFVSIWEAITSTATTLWQGLANFLTSLWTGIRELATSVWKAIQNTVTTAVNTVGSAISNAFTTARNAVATAVKAIQTGVSTAFNAVLSSVTSVCGQIYGAVKSGFDAAVAFIKDLAGQAFQWGADLLEESSTGLSA